MYTRRTLVMLSLAEGAVLWGTVALGAAFFGPADVRLSEDSQSALWRGFAFAVVCVLSLYAADLYDIVVLRRATAFPERLPCATAVAACLLTILYAIVPSVRLDMVSLVRAAAAGFVTLFAVRVALGRVLRRGHPERVLLLGEAPRLASVVDAIEGTPRGERVGEHIIVGVVDLGSDAPAARGDFDELVRTTRPDRIVVATLDRRLPLPLRELVESRLHGVAVEDWVPFYERLAGKIPLESLTPGSVAFGDGFGEARIHAAFARALGLVVALVGLVVLAPFLATVAVMIRLDSSGPVFFVQPRIGRFGRPYGLIKLRTMRVTENAPSEWAQDNAHRVTRVGRWLRRFRLDELPQLVNVLKGDMNLVGPRPHPVSNYPLFMRCIPHYALRSVVRPGITGWAQVRYGYANNLEEEIEKMRFDLYYVRNVSIWLDLRVLLATVRVVARGHEGVDFGMKPADPELTARAA
jgi:exopolysaccharide biosynthesis polyprenyl glycosylphosphotransferase